MRTYADPWVFESLISSDSLGRVNSQHLVNQVLSLWRNGVPFGRGKLETRQEKEQKYRDQHLHYVRNTNVLLHVSYHVNNVFL